MSALVPWLLACAAAAAALALWRELDARGRLVARACHEVRGPLTAARLGLHLATRPDAGAGLPALGVVDRELARVGFALDDLYAARRGLRARAAARGRVDLADLAAAAAEAVAPLARRHGAEVRLGALDAGAHVLGDRARLAQACHNLLANAAEHGGGVVELAVRRAGERVVLAVEDDGPGLPAPVRRLAARRSAGPRGHGLAVVADVAARHGGRLGSGPSARGARITLDLPAA